MKPYQLLLICCLAAIFSCEKEDHRTKLSQIRVLSYPINQPNVNGWDGTGFTGLADVYFTLTNKKGLNFKSPTEYSRYYNKTTIWDVRDDHILLGDLFEECVISLYDNDFNKKDDSIGSITFRLNLSTDNSSAPKFISDGKNLSFEIWVQE